MLSFLPAPISGSIAAFFWALNTLFWCALLYPFAIVKFLIPVRGVRRLCSRAMIVIAENWISCNSTGIAILHGTRWDVQGDATCGSGLERLARDRSYLVCANHRSWTDIVVLQRTFNRRIPFLRFFLKQELIYVPFLGIAWWALDFPFMKRYTRAYLEKHPEKRGKDLETTRLACERFRGSPISVLNFLEGTRLTPAKHAKTKSPFRHLLTPKAGGIAFVLDAMGEQFDAMLDVTIAYPGGTPSLWSLLSGRLKEAIVRVEEVKIPAAFLASKAGGSVGTRYLEDAAYREELQAWVRSIWERKDRQLDQLIRA